MIKTTDNNRGIKISEIAEQDITDLKEIGNKNISDLIKSNNLIIFTKNIKTHKDGIEKQKIFELSDEKLTTGNIMGFIGRNKTKMTITSRFADKDEKDYFLHYMLQKVMCLNIFNFNLNVDKNDNLYELLIYFFPYYLEKALNQGLYKEYHRNEYNDSNARGAINVKQHIKLNFPFTGKIAYTVREYVFDNPVMQLIRHTIEFMKIHKFGRHIINSNSTVIENVNNVNKVIFHTPGYKKNDCQKILNLNIKKTINHPYFNAYKDLQNICIRILQHDKITFGEQKDKIYGLLFDGAWLWEEYLNKILGTEYKHKESNKREGYRLFSDNGGKICPDFIRKSDNFIADAKYKRLEKGVNNQDYFQLLSYMLRFDSKKGCLIYPHEDKSCIETKVLLKGLENNKGDHEISLCGVKIPQGISDFNNFKTAMEESEEELVKKINEL